MSFNICNASVFNCGASNLLNGNGKINKTEVISRLIKKVKNNNDRVFSNAMEAPSCSRIKINLVRNVSFIGPQIAISSTTIPFNARIQRSRSWEIPKYLADSERLKTPISSFKILSINNKLTSFFKLNKNINLFALRTITRKKPPLKIIEIF